MIVAVFMLSFLFVQQELPKADVILDRMEKLLDPVQDFTVTLEGEVAMERIRVPKAVIRMYFKKPDKVHFESDSFSLVPREGMALSVAALRKRYDAETVALVDTGGVRWYKIQLAAKDPNTRLRQAYLYADATNWTVARFESSPYEGRMVTFDFEYTTVDGRYTLVSQMTATFGSVGSKSEDIINTPENVPGPASELREMQRMLRNGHVRFTYLDYRVNTGLSDSLFVRGE